MRAVIQRVSRAKVTVAGEIVGEISAGWLVLLGVAVVAGGYATRLWRVVPSAALAVVDRAR